MFSMPRPSTPAAWYRRASSTARSTISRTLKLLAGVPGSAAMWSMAMTGLGLANSGVSMAVSVSG